MATTRAAAHDVIETHVQPIMRESVDALAGAQPALAGMGRYHLGWVDEHFAPAENVDQGKRLRPEIALLCCQAAGGDPERAAPLAAAIELLHNFTLIHDDIQDRSPTRRHRGTVWMLWGEAQAINAGDALFAAAHLALYRLKEFAVEPASIIEIAEAFDRMTIAIVAGQVADISFEARSDVRPEEYLRMIAGKTAAIVQFAAWAGAIIAGAGAETAARFGEFGSALGLGFQLQDDLLGIWGSAAATGKASAGDIRRKKKSLPILTLRDRADSADADELDRLYAEPEIDAAGIERVLVLLAKHRVRGEIEALVRARHDEAIAALLVAAPSDAPARQALIDRVDMLASRSK